MAERPRIRLPFGQGLDRASGEGAASVGALADARNLYPREGKLALVPGLGGTPFPGVSWGTDVVCVTALRARKDVLLVVFDRVSRDLRVYRVNPITPATLQLAGTWATLDPTAALPRVVAAEAATRVLFAHEEPVYAVRLGTLVYTPHPTNDALVGTLAPLLVDFDADSTSAPVKFRGVVAYRDRVVGWGYGQETTLADQNRADVLRLSDPVDPLSWPWQNYFLVGVRDDPILAAQPDGPVLRLHKRGEAHRLVGGSMTDFGLQLADPLYGCPAARLAVTVGGAAYAWSATGPRVSAEGGASVDLGLPLELDGPQPADLAARGLLDAGFAIYDEDARLLTFAFPDVTTPGTPTLAYLCSLRDPSNPRWTFRTIGQALYTAGAMMLGKADPPPVSAYASALAVSNEQLDPANATVRALTLTWTNNVANGDELVEIFTRQNGAAGGSWALALAVGIGGASQSVSLSGFAPLAAVDLAIRIGRNGSYPTGFASPDPGAWTGPNAAGAKVSTVTGCGTPAITSIAHWRRTSPTATEIIVDIALADLQAPIRLEQSADGVSGWATVATLAPTGQVTRLYTYAIPAAEQSTTRSFRAMGDSGSLQGPTSPVVAAYLGPPTGTGTQLMLHRYGADRARAMFLAPAGATHLQVDASSDGRTSWVVQSSGPIAPGKVDVCSNGAYPGLRPPILSPGGVSDITLAVRRRYGVLGQGIVDWAEWSETTIALASSGVTYPPDVDAAYAPAMASRAGYTIWPYFSGGYPEWLTDAWYENIPSAWYTGHTMVWLWFGGVSAASKYVGAEPPVFSPGTGGWFMQVGGGGPSDFLGGVDGFAPGQTIMLLSVMETDSGVPTGGPNLVNFATGTLR